MEGLFSEHVALEVGLRGDLDNAESARIHLKDLHKLAIMISCAALAEDLTITLRQHDAASAGNSKDLVSVNPSYYKLDAETSFTKVAASNLATNTLAELNNAAGIRVFEVLAEELDVDNGYAYISVVFNDTTGSREGDVVYMSHAPRQKPAYEIVL